MGQIWAKLALFRGSFGVVNDFLLTTQFDTKFRLFRQSSMSFQV